MQLLKSRRICNIGVLKQIVHGEYWNGEIYGKFLNARYIYFKGQKVKIYPNRVTEGTLCEDAEEEAKLFYHGLKTISEIMRSKGSCNVCEHNIDSLCFDGKHLTVCDYEYSKRKH